MLIAMPVSVHEQRPRDAQSGAKTEWAQRRVSAAGNSEMDDSRNLRCDAVESQRRNQADHRLRSVKENLGAADVSFSDEDMAAIEARLVLIKVSGERLPPALLKFTYR